MKETMEDIWKVLRIYPGYSVELGRYGYRTNSGKGDTAIEGGFFGFLEGLLLSCTGGILTNSPPIRYVGAMVPMIALRAITTLYGYNLEKAGNKPE